MSRRNYSPGRPQLAPSPEETTATPRRRYAHLTFESIAHKKTITQMAKMLGMSKSTLRGAIERGELACIKFEDSDRVYVTEELVVEWTENYCTHQGNPVCAREVVA